MMVRSAKAIFLALLMALLPLPSMAGDMPMLNLLGFSEDGGIFAFEEYGIQDGSGFPYARRFYVDTARDVFVDGTPIRVRLDREDAALSEARQQARERGEAIVAEEELTAHPGYTAGWNAVTEQSAEPSTMRVLPRAIFPSPDEALEFRLKEIGLPGGGSCMGRESETKGFRLLRIDAADDDDGHVLHEDETLPKSRQCALGYTIAGVQTFFPDHGEPVFVVMIAVRSVGFEGPNYSWIAIPGHL